MKTILRFAVGALVLSMTAAAGARSFAQVTGKEPVVGQPCEGCEAVFVGLPAKLEPVARIGLPNEPGEPMQIAGIVRDRQGRPVPGIVVYAYQTDAKGLYPSGPVRHGRLRAWAISDKAGRYQFDTIRPGGYPGTDIPQHVHMHVIEPGRCTYYIDDVLFDDDPRLTAAKRRDMNHNRGGNGIIAPKKDASGRWMVIRDIVLGQGVPGYPPGR